MEVSDDTWEDRPQEIQDTNPRGIEQALKEVLEKIRLQGGLRKIFL
jgi:hypothetical protein